MLGITLGAAPNVDGIAVPAYGFEWQGMFIVNPRSSECGRFECSPRHYLRTEQEADTLRRMNAGRDLLAYWGEVLP